jgi:hypothetical protein
MAVDAAAQIGVVVIANTLPSDAGKLLSICTLGTLSALLGWNLDLPNYPQTTVTLCCP